MRTTTCYTKADIPKLLEQLAQLDKDLDARYGQIKNGLHGTIFLCPLLWQRLDSAQLQRLLYICLDERVCLEDWQDKHKCHVNQNVHEDYQSRKDWIAKMQNDLRSYAAQ